VSKSLLHLSTCWRMHVLGVALGGMVRGPGGAVRAQAWPQRPRLLLVGVAVVFDTEPASEAVAEGSCLAHAPGWPAKQHRGSSALPI
jgi:hypothetical protein